ncbi:MAG: gamma-glutamyltransferase, partial [Gemmatimonadetes bacterium]|nr:gamma-glutamyltransferase [Gemmatimonadota bacterium]
MRPRAHLRRGGVAAPLALALAVATAGAGTWLAVRADAAAPVRAGDPVRAPNGMVVSQSAIASEVGARVLEEGGNAIDAAVATGLALAVTHPTAGNIGGGGFMVVRFPDGRVTAYDFRERAPAAAHPDMFLEADGEYSPERHHNSHLAVGVPGTVAGFWMAHAAHGSRSWEDLVDPAVELARDGFPVSEDLADGLDYLLRDARERGYTATVDAYSNAGRPWTAGETIRLPDLARTLARIRDQGRDGFYRGETARMLAAEMERGGGWITEADLADYEAVEREPVV